MNLARTQASFMARLLDDTLGMPPRWDAGFARGLAVYRNTYRHALMDAMRATFPRTLAWAGERAFDAAAAHHLIGHPPDGWTLDDVGTGFAATARSLFRDQPDVGDLAALEWALHRVFTAADARALDTDALRDATCAFDDDDWAGMRLHTLPALAVVAVGSDCVSLWHQLGDGHTPVAAPALEAPAMAIVWRDGLVPSCRLVATRDGEALQRMADGATYGALCRWLLERHALTPDDAAHEAGRLLAGWVRAGLLAGVASTTAPLRTRP